MKIKRKNYIILRLSLIILTFFSGYITTINVFAQARQPCPYNGRLYPDGTIIGSLQCQNGRWVRIQ